MLRPADALGAIVAAGNNLWADDRARQRLLRIDGRTGRVRVAIPVDGRLALSATARDVWALPRGRGYGRGLRGPLLRVDADTGRVRARIPLVVRPGGGVLGFGVQAAGRNAWIWGPHDIFRVNGRSGRVTRRVTVADVHGELSGFVAVGNRLVAGTADGRIVAFDARTGRRLHIVPVGLADPAPTAVRGDLVLYTASGVVGAVRLANGRVVWRRRLGFRAGAVLGGDGLVWVQSSALHDAGDRVTALELRTGRVVTSGVLPVFGSTGIAAQSGRLSIATAGGRVVQLTPFAA
jgi:hypothetical protein